MKILPTISLDLLFEVDLNRNRGEKGASAQDHSPADNNHNYLI